MIQARLRAPAVLCLLAAAAAAHAQAPADLLARGAEAWSRRAEGHQGDCADPEMIGRAVDAYERALAAAPRDLEIRWRLMQALFFQGDYTGLEREQQLRVFERGRELGEAGLDQLAERVGGRRELDRLEPAERAERLAGEPHAAPVHFWTAVHWGLWGRARGKFAAARQGVAGKIRDLAQAVIELDERYDRAGGRRVLGRLHTEAPSIPFFTGWVSRETAVSELRRAVELAPEELGNQLFLAEALLESRRSLHAEALERLRALVELEPRPEYLVEDTRYLEDARALLARHAD